MNRLSRQSHLSRQPARRGIVLIIVLVVVAMLSLAAYTFAELMFSYRESAQLSGQQLQARSLVDSGADATRVFMAQDLATRQEAGGLFNNPRQFQGMVVINDDDPAHRGSFTVLAPNLDEDGNYGGVRYGLEDESTRLNLNALLLADKYTTNGGRTLLMTLPGMTEDVADAILDWLDEDEDPRENGAEQEYYGGLQPAYAVRNGPFATVEELLLVRGVSPQMLFGKDVNRNGMIDPHEQNLSLPDGVDNSDGSLNRGWSAYLTLFSQEKTINAQGLPRINLNDSDLQKLYDDLKTVFSDEWATFIIAYRQGGQPGSSTVAAAGATRTSTAVPASEAAGRANLKTAAKVSFSTVLDLVGATATVALQNDNKTTVIASPFTNEPAAMGIYFPLLMENVAASDAITIPGRININQAPRAILMGIPGMTEEIVTEILSRREAEPSDEQPNRRFETWILAEAIVTLDEMRAVMPFICGGGDVYRAQIIGYFQGGNAASRAEVVFDATQPTPRLLLWRDLSHLGRGYALETLGVDLTGIGN